jgi:prophage regulatory protein
MEVRMTELERLPSVVQRTTVSRSHLYALMKAGKFPKPVRLGARAIGWRVEDIDAWIATRPIGGSWRGAAQ